MKPVLPFKITRFLQSVVVITMLLVPAVLSGKAHAVCSNPAGNEGMVIYNDDHEVLQYCDDVNWIAVNKIQNPVVLTNGLVNHWKLEEAGAGPFVDQLGTNNCTVSSGPMASVPAKDGQGIHHTGDSSSCGTVQAIRNVSQFTMSAWLKRQTTGDTVFVGANDNDTNTVAITPYNDGAVYFVVSDGAAGWKEGYVLISDADWHHYTMVFDGTQTGNANRLKVYVDGKPATLSFNGTIPAVTTNTVPAFTVAESWLGNGYVDDVRVYNRPLTAQEAQELFLGTGGVFYGAPGYFVETAVASGNMGGLTGADALCLSRLQSGSWLGKATAQASGQLTAANVQAWLCSTSTCRNLEPYSTYYYASTLASSSGGNPMLIGENLFTANDGLAYGDNLVFGTAPGFREYLTGRTNGNLPAANTCGNWTTTAGTTNVAVSDTGDYGEKLSKYSASCSGNGLICLVRAVQGCADPAGVPGNIIYDDDRNMMTYCNGRTWVPFSARMNMPDTANLIAHYKFDHSAGTSLTDHAGSHTGTLSNFTLPAAWTAGHIGSNSLNFDGGDDYVSLATPGDFAFNVAGTYTWAMWINPDDFEEWNTVFGTYINPNTAPTFAISAHTTADTGWGPVTAGVSAGIDQSGTALNFHTTNNVLTVGTWSHVAVTYNGALAAASRIKIYVNGVDVTSGDVQITGVTTNSTPTNVRLAHNGWTDEFFDGRMDDFRFYTRLLSLGEIQSLAAYSPATGSCANPTATAGNIIYNNTANVVQFCNGKDWVAAGR